VPKHLHSLLAVQVVVEGFQVVALVGNQEEEVLQAVVVLVGIDPVVEEDIVLGEEEDTVLGEEEGTVLEVVEVGQEEDIVPGEVEDIGLVVEEDMHPEEVEPAHMVVVQGGLVVGQEVVRKDNLVVEEGILVLQSTIQERGLCV
jgi:hypothetical protein